MTVTPARAKELRDLAEKSANYMLAKHQTDEAHAIGEGLVKGIGPHLKGTCYAEQLIGLAKGIAATLASQVLSGEELKGITRKEEAILTHMTFAAITATAFNQIVESDFAKESATATADKPNADL